MKGVGGFSTTTEIFAEATPKCVDFGIISSRGSWKVL